MGDHKEGSKGAPMELMSQFLVLVSADTLNEDSAREAIDIGEEKYEPTNRVILEYRKTLLEYIERSRAEAKMGDSDEDTDTTSDDSRESDNNNDTSSITSSDSDAK